MVAEKTYTPDFKLLVNGRNVTEEVRKNYFRITVNDKNGDESDEIVLEFSGDFLRPRYGDELKLWLGYRESKLWNCGSFFLQTTEKDHVKERTIVRASSADFSSSLKVKRNTSHENLSVQELCRKIAARHGLESKCDMDLQLVHTAQAHESDLALLRRLAGNFNALFSIKNGTLLFLEKETERPVIKVRKEECDQILIQHANRQVYNSATVTWHDSKENAVKSVTAGAGEPEFILARPQPNEAMARQRAKFLLKSLKRRTKRGRIGRSACQMFAGSVLKLTGAGKDNGKYLVTESTCTLGNEGFTTDLTIESTGGL